eukprot:GHVN01058208.1.p1 GENE.GHVN01058208.1~~GHVN01058208.1.p1  ORF type:complete len:424 (-),score=65.12 GHVN01058208.1:328-1599(-)
MRSLSYRGLSSLLRPTPSRPPLSLLSLRQLSSEAGAVTHRPLTLLTDEQNELRESVRSYCDKELAPLVHQMDKAAKMEPSVITGLSDQGYLGIEIPVERGGCGMSFTESVIVIEEIARCDPSVAILVDIHNTLINRAVSHYGTPSQADRYLPLLANDWLGSFCLSESNSGSDAFSLQTKAEKVKGGWNLTGAKQWISNSKEAKIFLVFATADATKRHKGIGCFLVHHDALGLTVGNKYEKLGLRASSTCEVILDNVFVPDDQVLGEVGLGYKIAIDSLNEGRIGIAAQMLGLAQGAYDAALPYIHDRQQFGVPIADFQGMKFQYAEIAMQLEATRVLVYNAAALKEMNMPLTEQAAMAKIFAGRTAESVASRCVEFLGGYGFTSEYPVEKFFRDSKIGSIYEGTTNILLETIAKQIQKKHKEG